MALPLAPWLPQNSRDIFHPVFCVSCVGSRSVTPFQLSSFPVLSTQGHYHVQHVVRRRSHSDATARWRFSGRKPRPGAKGACLDEDGRPARRGDFIQRATCYTCTARRFRWPQGGEPMGSNRVRARQQQANNVALDSIRLIIAWYRRAAGEALGVVCGRTATRGSHRPGHLHSTSRHPCHTMPKTEAIIRVVNLRKSFGLSRCCAASPLTSKRLRLHAHRCQRLGKSTLLRCLNLLEQPTSGEVYLDGKPMGFASRLMVGAFRIPRPTSAG